MFSTLVHTALFVVLAARHVAAANLQIDTPTFTQCQTAQLSYSGGTGTYGLYIVPSEDSCADSLVDIPEQSGTSYQWKVVLPAGGQVEVLVEDSTGAEAWSGVVTVQNSTDSSCVDPKAVQALNAANGPASSNSSTSSSSVPSGANPTPSTTLTMPTYSAVSSVVPAASPAAASANAGLANAANGTNNPPTSGCIPRAALPAGSLLAAAAFLLAAVHL